MKELTIDLSDFENVDVRTFTIRKTTGMDAMAALERSVSPDAAARTPGVIVGARSRSQRIADAIVMVNGETVVTPYVQWENWGSRTQWFVEQAFDKINGVTNEEAERFLARLSPKPA